MNIQGFVDLQVNGHKGVDFSGPDLTEEKIVFTCQELFNAGTAAFLPTLITSGEDIYEKNLPLISTVMTKPEFKGKLLGIHLEGPFISSESGAVGAHDPGKVCHPSISHLDKLCKLAGGQVRLITIAAESTGATELTKHAIENGITVSLGHQAANENNLKCLAIAGAKAITHLGNGMPNLVNRHGNPLIAGLAEDGLAAMIITDGHHLPASLIKIILRTKGISKTIITSDASPLAGMPAGNYKAWGSDVVLENNGLLHNPQKECLAGSSATMLECMNYLASLGLLGEQELLKVGFSNPLELINVNPDTIKSDYTVVYNKEKTVFEIER